jgi:hypothetical protein
MGAAGVHLTAAQALALAAAADPQRTLVVRQLGGSADEPADVLATRAGETHGVRIEPDGTSHRLEHTLPG